MAVSNLGVAISKEKWDSLSDTEKALAKKMGIAPSKKKSDNESTPKAERKPRTAQDIKPYVLGVITDCQLCKETTIDLYNMVKNEKGTETYLVARKPSEPDVTPDKWEVRKASSCGCCKHVLAGWKKEDLINKVLEQALCIKAYKPRRERDAN